MEKEGKGHTPHSPQDERGPYMYSTVHPTHAHTAVHTFIKKLHTVQCSVLQYYCVQSIQRVYTVRIYILYCVAVLCITYQIIVDPPLCTFTVYAYSYRLVLLLYFQLYVALPLKLPEKCSQINQIYIILYYIIYIEAVKLQFPQINT